jgi:hypothetical protein
VAAWAFANHQIQFEIFQRRVQDFFHDRVQPVDFVDEQDVAGFKICQDRGKVPCPCQNRARGHAEIDAQLLGHDLGQCRLAQTGRAVEQRVVHRLAPAAGRFDKDPQVGARFGLADKIVQ